MEGTPAHTTSPPRDTARERVLPADPAVLAELVDELAVPGRRFLLGIAGGPGSGKSTLAAGIVAALAHRSALVVPMDGFHLANATLRQTPWVQRKGAIQTFDAVGLAVLMERLRAAGDDVVYAPSYEREVEEPIAQAIAVGPEVEIVVLEGNYLLVDDPAWTRVRACLDETWYLEVPDELRRRRLVDRHVRFGRSPQDAQAWATTSDEPNATLVAASRGNADRVVVEERPSTAPGL